MPTRNAPPELTVINPYYNHFHPAVIIPHVTAHSELFREIESPSLFSTMSVVPLTLLDLPKEIIIKIIGQDIINGITLKVNLCAPPVKNAKK